MWRRSRRKSTDIPNPGALKDVNPAYSDLDPEHSKKPTRKIQFDGPQNEEPRYDRVEHDGIVRERHKNSGTQNA